LQEPETLKSKPTYEDGSVVTEIIRMEKPETETCYNAYETLANAQTRETGEPVVRQTMVR